MLARVVFGIFIFWRVPAFADDRNYPIQTVHSETESVYTKLLIQKMESWPPVPVTSETLAGREVQLKVYETPGNRDYIGTELSLTIKSPISTVEKIMDDVEHYKDLLPGFAQINITHKEGNRFDVFWEKIIPVFFVKNVKYTVTYWADKSKPDRRIYRSQLTTRRGLNALDGLVILEKKGDKTTYHETAFFDGDFGMMTTIAPMKIWRDSVEAVLHGALAKKQKAEAPEKSYDSIMSDVLTGVKTYPVESLVNAKKPYPQLPLRTQR